MLYFSRSALFNRWSSRGFAPARVWGIPKSPLYIHSEELGITRYNSNEQERKREMKKIPLQMATDLQHINIRRGESGGAGKGGPLRSLALVGLETLARR